MGWGRLKPFWKSNAWKESAEKGTGIFSWGDSDYAKILDFTGSPGLGTGLDNWLDNLAKAGKDGAFDDKSSVTPKQAVNTASFLNNNQMALYALIGLVAYKVFIK